MDIRGHYYNLVTRQTSESEFQDEKHEEEETKESQIVLKESDRRISYIDNKQVSFLI